MVEDVVIKKFTIVISSPSEFLVLVSSTVSFVVLFVLSNFMFYCFTTFMADCVVDADIIFLPCGFFYLLLYSSFFLA